MSNAYKDLFSNGGCTELDIKYPNIGKVSIDNDRIQQARDIQKSINDNSICDITVRVTHENVDSFTMKVLKQELDAIKRFISELNASSDVSIKIIDIE